MTACTPFATAMDYYIEQKQVDKTLLTIVEGLDNAQDYVNFSVIPTWILRSNLKPNEKLIVGLINTFNTNNKEFFGSNDFLARSLSLSQQTIANTVSRLIKKGIVIGIYNDKGKSERKGLTLNDQLFTKHKREQGLPKEVTKVEGLPKQVRGYTQISKGGYSNKEHTKDITKDTTKEVSKDTRKNPNPEIQELVDYLISKLGTSLDGSQKTNRQYCFNLLRKIKKDYPGKDAVGAIKSLVDVGLTSDFHSKNLTGFKYLYYNTQKIIKDYQQKKVGGRVHFIS